MAQNVRINYFIAKYHKFIEEGSLQCCKFATETAKQILVDTEIRSMNIITSQAGLTQLRILRAVKIIL
jgi:hypothetical protein